MIYDRYYYSTLSPKDKKIYRQIYRGIQNFETHIKLPKPTVSLQKLLQYIDFDNPLIFYVDFSNLEFVDNVISDTLILTYFYSRQDAKKINDKIQSVLKKMSSRIQGRTDYEKEKSIHDLLIENVIYDTLAAGNIKKYYPRSNSILGVLFYKTAVCEGIAKVTKILLNSVDIKCIVVVGFSSKNNEGHAWNIVEVNGDAYHLDVTWDTNISFENDTRYDYFNLTDKQIKTDHIFNTVYPVCSSVSENYFYKNGLIVKEFGDIQKLFTVKMIQKKRTVTFKFAGKNTSEFKKAVDKSMDLIKASVKPGKTVKITYSLNDTQQICTIAF